jgi:hypothetical protein
LTDTLSLNTAEPLQLLGLDRDPASESDLAGRALDKGHTVGVQGLVDGSGTGLSASYGYATLIRSLDGSNFVTRTQSLDDSCPHSKFNTIEGEEPKDVLPKKGILDCHWN